jgi:hypothetical protein
MKVNSLFIIIVLSLISIASTCRAPIIQQSTARTYKISGKIWMINNCTKSIADLPNKVLVESDLTFVGKKRDDAAKFRGEKFNVIPVAGTNNESEASYEFMITTTDFGDTWIFITMGREHGGKICDEIKCPADKHCMNTATHTSSITPADDGDSDPTYVTRDFRFDCNCN